MFSFSTAYTVSQNISLPQFSMTTWKNCGITAYLIFFCPIIIHTVGYVIGGWLLVAKTHLFNDQEEIRIFLRNFFLFMHEYFLYANIRCVVR